MSKPRELEEQNEKLKDELKGYKMGADIEAREGDIARAQARKLAEALELIRKHGCDDSHAWLNAEQALKDFRGEIVDNDSKVACKFCKKKDKPLCEHGFCPKCGCKQYCWID